MWDNILDSNLMQWLAGLLFSLTPMIIDYGFALLRAVLVLFIGLWLARRLSYYANRTLVKFTYIEPTIRNFIPVALKYLVMVFTFVIVLAQVGVQTASIIALLGAAGLAIGLALQGTLQNIAAGLMLLILRPFKVGDYIEAGSVVGTIEQVGLFETQLKSIKGQFISVPNSNLWNVMIVNYSTYATARIDVDISIAYEDDIDKALEVLKALAMQDNDILKSPEPQYLVVRLGASGVDIRLRCWVDSGNQWAIGFRLNRDVKYAIEAAGCSIPYPQRVVHIQKADD